MGIMPTSEATMRRCHAERVMSRVGRLIVGFRRDVANRRTLLLGISRRIPGGNGRGGRSSCFRQLVLGDINCCRQNVQTGAVFAVVMVVLARVLSLDRGHISSRVDSTMSRRRIGDIPREHTAMFPRSFLIILVDHRIVTEGCSIEKVSRQVARVTSMGVMLRWRRVTSVGVTLRWMRWR